MAGIFGSKVEPPGFWATSQGAGVAGSGVTSSNEETTTTRVRNALPITINEVRFATRSNSTDQFIELYNASAAAVDLSNWTLIHAPSQWAPVRLATIPPGTKLAPGGDMLRLAASGLYMNAPTRLQ